MWMHALYSSVASLTPPLWSVIGKVRQRKGKEHATRLCERFGVATQPRPQGPLMWFHGASVGESRALLPLIHEMLDRWPALSVLLTTQTLSAFSALETQFSPRFIHSFFPYDCPQYARRFLSHWQPQAFCVTEAELWPCAWHALFRQQIPLFLVNFQLSQGSFQRWQWARRFFQFHYSFFRERWTGSEQAQSRFGALTGLSMALMPSLKYAGQAFPYDETECLTLKQHARPVWLASCCHAEEEDFILNAHAQLKQSWPHLTLLYIPRHIHRSSHIEQKSQVHKWHVQRRSQAPFLKADTDIYIVDTLGETALFYAACPFVVMGGSFAPIGGHNLIEPALLECAILHGPHMEKTQDLAESFQTKRAAVPVSHQALVPQIAAWLHNPTQVRDFACRARAHAERQQAEVIQWTRDFSERVGNLILS